MPVQFVSTPDVGVPSSGVTSVGDVASTTDPVPVVATAVSAVAPELTPTIFKPLPAKSGNLAEIPDVMASNSERAAEDDNVEDVVGYVVCK